MGTLPFKPRDKPTKPSERLPSLPPDKMQNKQTVADQLRHAKEQLDLAKWYPGRTPRS